MIAKARSKEELMEGIYKALRQKHRLKAKAEEKGYKLFIPSQRDLEKFVDYLEKNKMHLRKIALTLGLLSLSRCFFEKNEKTQEVNK